MPEFPPDAAPREIVTALHDQMAEMSPEFAALVAAYRQTRAAGRVPPATGSPASPRPSRRGPYLPSLERAARYRDLRDAGAGKHVAAAHIRLRPRTADRYEARYLAAMGGGT
jgi:hypothetical protein